MGYLLTEEEVLRKKKAGSKKRPATDGAVLMLSYSFDLALKCDESATDKNKHFYSDMDSCPQGSNYFLPSHILSSLHCELIK